MPSPGGGSDIHGQGQDSIVFLWVATMVASCASNAPETVRGDRIRFDEAVFDTNGQQLLLNVLRARDGEQPVFSNTIELDNQSALSGSISGGTNTIGGNPVIGLLNGNLSATQQPTSKTLIPYGYDLISQYDTPITLGSFTRLYHSNWPLAATLDFVLDRLTPGYQDYNRAVNLILALDTFGALLITQDSDYRIRLRFNSHGIVTEPAEEDEKGLFHCLPGNKVSEVEYLWTQLRDIFGQHGAKEIALYSTDGATGGVRKDFRSGTEVFTRPAIGALKDSESYFTIESEDGARAIIDANRNSPSRFAEFYYVPDERNPTVEGEWFATCKLLGIPETRSEGTSSRQLGRQRSFALIVRGPVAREAVAYSVTWKGDTYSVLDDDATTKKNLALLSTLLTIEAKPATNPPTPTVLSLTPAVPH